MTNELKILFVLSVLLVIHPSALYCEEYDEFVLDTGEVDIVAVEQKFKINNRTHIYGESTSKYSLSESDKKNSSEITKRPVNPQTAYKHMWENPETEAYKRLQADREAVSRMRRGDIGNSIWSNPNMREVEHVDPRTTVGKMGESSYDKIMVNPDARDVTNNRAQTQQLDENSFIFCVLFTLAFILLFGTLMMSLSNNRKN